MLELRGPALLATVTTLTSLGFLMMDYDNGLLGGLVNGDAFNDTFDKPSQTMIGTIVSIYNSRFYCPLDATERERNRVLRISIRNHQSAASSAPSPHPSSAKPSADAKASPPAAFIMILGSPLQSTAYTRAHIIVARIVSGCGLGFINSTVPVFQSEFSPKASRGLYVCMQLSTLNIGTDLVYWIDYAFSMHAGSYAWRVPVILQCVFLFPMLLIVAILPESPRWLAAHNRSEESLSVLRRLKGHSLDDQAVVSLHNDIVRAVEEEGAMNAGSRKTLLKADRIHSRRRLVIACAIQAFQQLGGIHAIIYYSSTLFRNVGFSTHLSALMSGFLQLWFFVPSFIPWLLIDRVGRRPLLLSMISVMALVMATQAALVYQVQYKTEVAYAAGIAGAIMLFLFEGAFTVGFQATVWVYPSEILPLRLRQKGSSITPPAIENVGWRTYIVFAVLNATWVPIIYLFFPESKGRELEDFDRLFAGEEDAVITATMAGNGDPEHLGRSDMVAAKGRVAHKEKGFEGLV